MSIGSTMLVTMCSRAQVLPMMHSTISGVHACGGIPSWLRCTLKKSAEPRAAVRLNHGRRCTTTPLHLIRFSFSARTQSLALENLMMKGSMATLTTWTSPRRRWSSSRTASSICRAPPPLERPAAHGVRVDPYHTCSSRWMSRWLPRIWRHGVLVGPGAWVAEGSHHWWRWAPGIPLPEMSRHAGRALGVSGRRQSTTSTVGWAGGHAVS
uniref:Uncharacterized protein n=1 Tax=Arundo donax TaxID=35708 RepID=A0A0A9ABT6_ARUDO